MRHPRARCLESDESLIDLGDYRTADIEITTALQNDRSNATALSLRQQLFDHTQQPG